VATPLLFLGAVVATVLLIQWVRPRSQGPASYATPGRALESFLSPEAKRFLGLQGLRIMAPTFTQLGLSGSSSIAAAVGTDRARSVRVLLAEIELNEGGWSINQTHSVCLSHANDQLVLVPFPTSATLVYQVGETRLPNRIDLDGVDVRVDKRDGSFAAVTGETSQVDNTAEVYSANGPASFLLDEREVCGDSATGDPAGEATSPEHEH